MTYLPPGIAITWAVDAPGRPELRGYPGHPEATNRAGRVTRPAQAPAVDLVATPARWATSDPDALRSLAAAAMRAADWLEAANAGHGLGGGQQELDLAG